ncbi:sphingosine-1-phosphate phosphatase [Favolaschia claudopus]|uniref:DASH complex subunit DUO1 n=1 Tax=Favolaschia claudopus TaxID=2862362 RepID=A0AAW0DYJ2_9AGAR
MSDTQSILLNSSSGGSHLLSETPFLSQELTPREISENDLSISELSLSGKDGDAQFQDPAELERAKRHGGRSREEKLQNDLLVLKKLNAALSSFNDALGDVGSQNERVAAQLVQTEALLNKYVGILSRSEEFARLIFDEEWQGAEADELTLAQEQREVEEKALRLETERLAAAKREQERLQQEESNRAAQKEKDRADKERSEKVMSRGGVRGVRGTRASMRAASRGVGRGASSSGPTVARGSATTRASGRRS